MSISEASAAWKSFLETTPPNTQMEIQGVAAQRRESGYYSIWFLSAPHIHLHCEHDDGSRRFEFTGGKEIHVSSSWNYNFITYQCRDCGTTKKTFAVLIIRDGADCKVMKLGEYPPFSAPISSRIEKLLTKSDLEFYRKGVRAEAQGLGIGAATYFRRIVEEQWQRLVTEIRRAAERLGVEDLGVYDAALRETQFSKAVAMLKDAIPEKLLIVAGKNPLTLLYQPLSQQLHELTDEACLQQAADIRVVLTVLLENIADVMKDQDELSAAATRLKER